MPTAIPIAKLARADLDGAPAIGPLRRRVGHRLRRPDVAEVEHPGGPEPGAELQPGLEIAGGRDDRGRGDEEPGQRRSVDRDEDREQDHGGDDADVPAAAAARDLGGPDVADAGPVVRRDLHQRGGRDGRAGGGEGGGGRDGHRSGSRRGHLQSAKYEGIDPRNVAVRVTVSA